MLIKRNGSKLRRTELITIPNSLEKKNPIFEDIMQKIEHPKLNFYLLLLSKHKLITYGFCNNKNKNKNNPHC